MRLPRFLLALVAITGVALSSPAAAVSVRIATAFDPQTMDPHSLALLYHTRVVFQIYDSLINRDEQYRPEPGMALSWQATGPKTWQFKLRPGITFSDGSPFTADDAVFSIQRALGATSQRAFQLKGVTAVRKIDDLTLEVSLETPDAVLPEKFVFMPIMSKAWAVAPQGRDRTGLQRQAGNLRRAQRHGLRALPARALRARREDRAQEKPALVGLERQALGQRR